MFKLTLDNIFLNNINMQITYNFQTGKLYALYLTKSDKCFENSLFRCLTRLEKPIEGNIYINDICINYFSEEYYRHNIITLIDDEIFSMEHKKVIKYLLGATNNFETFKDRNKQERIELITNLIVEFDCEKNVLKKKICDLEAKEKIIIKIVESLIMNSPILIVSNFAGESLEEILKYIQLFATKYCKCVLAFINSESAISYFDEVIYI